MVDAIHEIRLRFIACACSRVEELAASVHSITPTFDHYVDDHQFSKPLAKKHLTNTSEKDGLSRECVQLFHAMAEVGKLQKAFKVKSLLEIQLDGLRAAEKIFKQGKKAVTIQTACHVVLAWKGEEQRTEAEQLLDTKKQELPKALVAELEEVKGAPKVTKPKSCKK